MNGKSSTLLVIVIAALALFCFAVKSFYDYQVTKLKLEHGMDPAGQTDTAVGADAGGVALPAPPPVAPAAGATLQNPALPAAAAGPATAPTPAPASAAVAATDPELERMRLELEALRQENSLYAEKIDQIRDGSGTPAAGSAPATAAVAAAPTVTAEEQAELDALRAQVTNAPAIGQVARCDWEFDLVWINGGLDRNIKAAEKFAVRRGYEIMGFLTIEEAFDTYSVSKMISNNRDSETARKPQPGDDVIKWPLF